MFRCRDRGCLPALLALIALVACGDDRLPPRMTIESVAHLAPPMPRDAMVESPDGFVREAILQPGGALGGGGGRPTLVVTSPSRLRLRVEVPPDTVLRLGMGVEGSKRREAQRSGVRFGVTVDGREVATDVLNPARHRADRRWRDRTIDLRPWAGRTVELVLETEAEDTSMPIAGSHGWSNLRLVRTKQRERQRARADAPNVLVLLVDTLRADRLGVYGATPSPTPNLDRLAGEGLVFLDGVAQAPWTMPSVATLLSGLHPRSHGAEGDRIHGAVATGPAQNAFLADAVTTWPELVQRAGITTFGVSANPLVSRATNMAQGFETFVEFPFDPTTRNWSTADDVDAAFLAWAQANPGLRFAAWLHYMDTHDPYMPPDHLRPAPPPGLRPLIRQGRVNDVANPINRRGAPPLGAAEIAFLKALYDAEIRAWDESLGRLLAGLDRLGLRESTIIVVTADHGEEFQEHGRLKHGTQLYEETIRVPVVMVGPGIPTGRRPDTAQGIDLMPTLLARLGVAVATELPGRDLLATSSAPPAVSETRNGILPDGRPADLASLRTPEWKMIHAPHVAHRELYDLQRDPAERRNVQAEREETAAFDAALAAWASAVQSPPRPGGSDVALHDKLRQLGYVE